MSCLPCLPAAQGFRTPEEVQRFHEMFDELCYIVATKHSGSLKGEHGTGRNVAPYVEMEWGERLGGPLSAAAFCFPGNHCCMLQPAWCLPVCAGLAHLSVCKGRAFCWARRPPAGLALT